MKRLVIVTALAVGLAMPAWGQDSDAGFAAYERGDYPAALKEWRPLAEQGNAYAQFNLGFMHGNGEGVAQDDAEAVEWYRRAAEQGLVVAQHNLGLMYAKGEGVLQDYVQAHKWFNLAAIRGSDEARDNRDFVAEEMTRDQIAQAQRLAREWQPKAE